VVLLADARNPWLRLLCSRRWMKVVYGNTGRIGYRTFHISAKKYGTWRESPARTWLADNAAKIYAGPRP
jgi:hypothetical protein